MLKVSDRSVLYDESRVTLNHLMVLHVHCDHTDKFNLVDVANEFIADNEHRRQVFANEFKETDLYRTLLNVYF